MKVSIYSTGWHLKDNPSFDVADALLNWAVYADEISVACGDYESLQIVNDTAHHLGLGSKMKLTPVTYARDGSDPFAYGKTENAALQACTGDLLIQQNLDERLRVDPAVLHSLHNYLSYARHSVRALWVPTIDLYGSDDRCLPRVGKKWYIAIGGAGLRRGAVGFGLKPDGRPNYDLTSTDELLMSDGSLAPAVMLAPEYNLAMLPDYVAQGWPISYHLGFRNLGDRLERSLWWKAYWEKATGGDSNQHPTSVAEMASKATVPHNLPLWPTIPLDNSPQGE